MDPAHDALLKSAKRIYVTTWGPSGKSGTVPVWFMAKDGRLYFTTLRESLKARRIRATGRVRVHLGSPDGPGFAGRAAEVSDRPDLEHEILQTYCRKYPILVPLFMGRRIRRRLQRKESVVIQITPEGS
ncbi:MAG: pyridoxamine 5'-phosphate oxidase family protein [Candidatus Rokubacteria bacterium]|nr:pyridoxamine 5'-phosphate oxidase family protein [Candidatus Rokubacteria bacterium]